MKTRKDVQELKQQWRNDPYWDLKDSDGFEEYAEELRKFQDAYEREFAIQNQKRFISKRVSFVDIGGGKQINISAIEVVDHSRHNLPSDVAYTISFGLHSGNSFTVLSEEDPEAYERLCQVFGYIPYEVEDDE